MAEPIKNERQWLVKTRTIWSASVFLLAVSCATAAIAEPVVIDDRGPTRPMTDYVFMPDPALPPITKPSQYQDLDALLSQVFPVKTANLTPGDVPRRVVELPQLPAPLFLIGTDPRSREWLLQYRNRLQDAQAVGLVVEAASLAEFHAVEAIADGLSLTPAPVPQLAKRLGLQHYPVLISRTLIEQ